MNPNYVIKRLAELDVLVRKLEARIKALEERPKPGRPPKNEADRLQNLIDHAA